MIGIIGAMDVEVNDIVSALQNKEIIKKGIYTYFKGTIFSKEVVILKSGIGKVASAVGASLMIELFHPNLIINTGIAGGVAPLKTKDIVLSQYLTYGDVDATIFGYEIGQVPQMPHMYAASKKYLAQVEEILKKNNYSYQLGTTVTSDSFITTLENVKSIKYENMICEMEGASIAQACYILNTPFISVRYISDIIDSDSQVDNYMEFEGQMANRSCKIILDLISDLKI